MSKPIYIRSSKSISVQNENQTLQLLDLSEPFISAIEPDYSELISPRMLRRMNKLVKMSYFNCLKLLDNDNLTLNAIITATGLGCLKETITFLHSITDEDASVTPTAFINSTHNTPGGHLANLLQQNCFNTTHTQRGISFEMALLEAQLFTQNNQNNILVGGFDEIQPMLIDVLASKNLLSNNDFNTHQLKVPFTEGSAYFLLDAEPSEKSIALNSILVTKNNDFILEIENQIESFAKKGLTKGLILSGNTGSKNDRQHYKFLNQSFADIPVIEYKKYLGEFACVSALSLDLACKILWEEKNIPTLLNQPDFIIIYNFTTDNYSSLMIVSND